MYGGLIHFTVSMWNRKEHLELLVRNFGRLWKEDRGVRLHVCAFEGEDATMEELRQIVQNSQCPSSFVYRFDEFGNGLGHNTAAAVVKQRELLSMIAVDVRLPMKTLTILREVVRGGEAFYRPRLGVMDKDDKRVEGVGAGWGRGLLSCMKSDFMRAGGMLPRTPWSVSHGQVPEDQALAVALKGLGLRGHNKKLSRGFCRFHARDPRTEYYRVLRSTELSKWPLHIQQGVAAAIRVEELGEVTAAIEEQKRREDA